MCLICIEIAKGSMTVPEARRALGEMREKVGSEHAREVEKTLAETEKQQRSSTKP
ncbi:MAG TPA: hypothetical protein VFQ53_08765 [Kofleriaceae bacterium]|nr:hypothetical protein [Kofleriaceae bacterium]